MSKSLKKQILDLVLDQALDAEEIAAELDLSVTTVVRLTNEMLESGELKKD